MEFARDAVRGRAVNEFLEQFLIESRELAEQATDGLLALEESPGDAERLDERVPRLPHLEGRAPASCEFRGDGTRDARRRGGPH